MIAWTKSFHIAALMIWSAGLLILPYIYARRNGLRGEPLHEVHRLARTAFVHVTSPAAFVAVVAGMALIFLRDVFTVWMALKLLLVGALVIVHVRHGHVLLHLFDPGGAYARWRQYLATAVTLTLIVGILGLVLAKPIFEIAALPDWLTTPGGLQSLLETIMPIP